MSARTGDPIKNLVPKTIMAESTNEVTLGDAGRNQISVSGVSGLAPSQVWGAGSGHCGKSSKHLRNFRVGTLNVNTLKGRVCEVVETLSRRKVDLCCVQETRYRGGHCRIITGKDSWYKLFWSGNNKGTAGVSVCGREVDREGIWGQASLRPDHPGEDHSRSAGALSSVCLCPTVWSQWFCKGSILRPT